MQQQIDATAMTFLSLVSSFNKVHRAPLLKTRRCGNLLTIWTWPTAFMKIADVRLLQEAGASVSLAAVRPSDRDGWILMIQTGSGGYRPLRTFRGQVRVVRSLDAIHKIAAEVGIESFSVHLSQNSLEQLGAAPDGAGLS